MFVMDVLLLDVGVLSTLTVLLLTLLETPPRLIVVPVVIEVFNGDKVDIEGEDAN